MLLQISISEQYLGKNLPKSTVAGHEELAAKISYHDQYSIYQSSIIHSVCPKFFLKYFSNAPGMTTSFLVFSLFCLREKPAATRDLSLGRKGKNPGNI